MRLVLCVFAVLAVGCGGPVDSPLTEYVIEGVHFWSEVPLDVGVVTAQVKEARSVLAPKIPPKEFDRLVSFIQYYVVAEEKWGDVGMSGQFNPTGGITISANFLCFRHETLHAWDWSHYAVGTVGHEHWDTNGYAPLIAPCGTGHH